jgi:putative endonuclease
VRSLSDAIGLTPQGLTWLAKDPQYMFYTYILQSLKDSGIYIGHTENIEVRLKEHNSGKNSSTKNRIPLKLIHYEAFLNEKDAIGREKYLKSGWGTKSIKTLLANYLSTRSV